MVQSLTGTLVPMGFNYFLNRTMQPVSLGPGESGYFSAPTETLDHSLFEDGDPTKFRQDTRQWVLDTLYSFWSSRYNNPRRWSKVWIAGSAISYQWSEARGNGDLDVLIGIDWPKFQADNPQFRAMPETDLAAIINKEFHSELWPKTAEQNIHGRIFEVTFYVNPNSADIRNIRPYAAYNLTDDEWTVHPPMGQDFEHPEAFYTNAEREHKHAFDLVNQYNQAAEQAKAMQPGTPGWHNAMRQAEILSAQAASMYEDLHTGRRQAFGSSGSGYGDYYNFRWQYHKKHGSAQALNAVGKSHKAALEEYQASVYGKPIDAADVALRRAALWNRGLSGRV